MRKFPSFETVEIVNLMCFYSASHVLYALPPTFLAFKISNTTINVCVVQIARYLFGTTTRSH